MRFQILPISRYFSAVSNQCRQWIKFMNDDKPSWLGKKTIAKLVSFESVAILRRCAPLQFLATAYLVPRKKRWLIHYFHCSMDNVIHYFQMTIECVINFRWNVSNKKQYLSSYPRILLQYLILCYTYMI